MKHKVIYIESYIAKNHPQVDNDEESISSTFLDELNRGGLTVPTLSTVFFVHCGIQAQSAITSTNMRRRTYVMNLLTLIQAPVAKNVLACRLLANLLLKSHLTANSDREKSVGCLRRKEKFTS